MSHAYKTQEAARKASESLRGYNGTGRALAVYSNGVEGFFALGSETSKGTLVYGLRGIKMPRDVMSALTGY